MPTSDSTPHSPPSLTAASLPPKDTTGPEGTSASPSVEINGERAENNSESTAAASAPPLSVMLRDVSSVLQPCVRRAKDGSMVFGYTNAGSTGAAGDGGSAEQDPAGADGAPREFFFPFSRRNPHGRATRLAATGGGHTTHEDGTRSSAPAPPSLPIKKHRTDAATVDGTALLAEGGLTGAAAASAPPEAVAPNAAGLRNVSLDFPMTDDDCSLSIMQSFLNVIQQHSGGQHRGGDGDAEVLLSGAPEASVSAQIECVRALFNAARRRPASTDASGGTDGPQDGVAGALPADPISSGFASSMAQFFSELKLSEGAAGCDPVDGAAAVVLGEGGPAAPGDATDAVGETTQTTSEVHDSVSYDEDSEDLATLQLNLDDFRLRLGRLAQLSPATLAALAEHAKRLAIPADAQVELVPLRVEDPNSAALAHCLGEVAAIAASMLWWCVEGKANGSHTAAPAGDSQQPGATPLQRLQRELHNLPEAQLQLIVTSFGVSIVDADDIYNALSGVGVLLFSQILPLPLLMRVCEELSIPTSDEASMDPQLLPDVLAEKISAYMNPMRDGVRLSAARVTFLPRLQVHEHAPGSYTCTVDNAMNMGRMSVERLISNRFSCSKVKWRAVLTCEAGQLSLRIWHRHSTSLATHLLIRTSEPKKRRQGNNGKGGGAAHNGAGGAAEQALDELRANSALLVEREYTAEPGELAGFDKFVELAVALRSSTTSQHGLRIYNRADDRIIFQLSLGITPLGADGGAARAQRQVTDGASHAMPPRKESKDQLPPAEVSKNESFAALSNVETLKDGNTVEGTARGRRQQQQQHARLRERLVSQEVTTRGALESAWYTNFRAIQNAEYKEKQRAQQRTREREHKALLAKVGPPPELQQEVSRMTQTVEGNRQLVSKLAKEKTKEEKKADKMRQRIAEAKEELYGLHELLRVNANLLGELESKTKVSQTRSADKRRRLHARRTKRAEAERWDTLEPTTTRHEALCIDDLGCFLGESTTPSAAKENTMFFTTAPAEAAQSFSAVSSTTTAAAIATRPPISTDLMQPATAGVIGINGSSASSSAAPPLFSTRRDVVGFDAAAMPSNTPVFSTQPTARLPRVSPSSEAGGGGATSSPGDGVSLSGAAAAPSPSPSGLSTQTSALGGLSFGGLTPSVFSTNPVTHSPMTHMTQLDIHAQPFNPVSSSTRPPQSQSRSPAAAPMSPFAFTVTAGGVGSTNSPLNTAGTGAASLFSDAHYGAPNPLGSPGSPGGVFSSVTDQLRPPDPLSYTMSSPWSS